MSNARDEVLHLVQDLPPTASYEDILYEIYVKSSIEKGLDDLRHGRVISHEQAMERLKKWVK